MSDSTPTHNAKTVLGPDCRITGRLSLNSDVVLEGKFKGALHVAGTLELSPDAQITGTIVARHVRIAGRAEADVIADDAVELLADAVLIGRIYTCQLAVAQGAVFQGDVCIGPNAVQAAHESFVSDEHHPQPPAAASDDQVAPQHVDPQQPAAPSDTPRQDKSVITTMPGSVNAMLQRRRGKILSASNGQVIARNAE